ncbi:hypothetical protein diail_6724 [Diaporthe ilicicola]|nr:hypothetical protein diail_6724 [Diaporthe ilicicola]
MAAFLFTAQMPFDGNIWDMLRQYVAGISIEWPDISEQWAKFSDWLSQPRKLNLCDHQSRVALNDRQMSWRLSLLGGSHSPSSGQ